MNGPTMATTRNATAKNVAASVMLVLGVIVAAIGVTVGTASRGDGGFEACGSVFSPGPAATTPDLLLCDRILSTPTVLTWLLVVGGAIVVIAGAAVAVSGRK